MSTTEIVKLDPKEFGIEPKQATELMTNLPLIKKERELLITRFDEVSKMDRESPETAKLAREVRLAIRDNRTKGIMDWHKKSKEVFLRGGQFVDAIKNQEIAINERMESLLADVEKHAENLEKARLEKLQEERLEIISPYIEDTTGLQLGTMDVDVFEAYVFLQKKKHEDRIEAEKEAEKQRIAKEKVEEVEREKVRLENEKLKAEADKREKEIEAERKKLEVEANAKKERNSKRMEEMRPYIQFIRKYDELLEKSDEDYAKEMADTKRGAEDHWEFERTEQIRIQREKDEAEKVEKAERLKLKAESDKKQADINAKLEAERKEKEALQAQIKAKQDADDKYRAERKAEEEKDRLKKEELANAPIKEQLIKWVEKFEIPTSSAGHEVKDNIIAKFDSFINWSKKEIEKI